MTIEEIKKIIEHQESIGSTYAILDISKPKSFKLKGYKLRTPFGLAEVYNVREYDSHNGFTVRCELSGMKKFLIKLALHAPTPNPQG